MDAVLEGLIGYPDITAAEIEFVAVFDQKYFCFRMSLLKFHQHRRVARTVRYSVSICIPP